MCKEEGQFIEEYVCLSYLYRFTYSENMNNFKKEQVARIPSGDVYVNHGD